MAIELKSITKENYFYHISGIAHGNKVILHYQKTYDYSEASVDRIIENGKSIIIPENGEFTISTRDQGIHNIFLLAEDSISHCLSSIVPIPVAKKIKSIVMRNPFEIFINHRKAEFVTFMVSSTEHPRE